MRLSSIVTIVVGACIFAALLDTASKSGSASKPPTNASAPLLLLSSHCSSEHGFRQIVGQVRNTTDSPIASVTAVGTFVTSRGQFVKVESALLEYDPIMPGQTSPLRVMATENPEISTCEIACRSLFGPVISHKR